MTNWLRYGLPRRFLLRLSNHVPERSGGWLLDFLYPSNCRISFPLDALDDQVLDAIWRGKR